MTFELPNVIDSTGPDGPRSQVLQTRGGRVRTTHLELVVSVFGSFVEGPVVPVPPDVVDPVEALDAVGDSVHLEDADAVRHWGHGVDLEVWAQESKERTEVLTGGGPCAPEPRPPCE